MFNEKVFKSTGILLGKLYEKARGIGYKLGLVEYKIENIDLSKIPEIKLQGYQYPHQHEELERTYRDKILPSIEMARKFAHNNHARL